jgi:hypothetical protein
LHPSVFLIKTLNQVTIDKPSYSFRTYVQCIVQTPAGENLLPQRHGKSGLLCRLIDPVNEDPRQCARRVVETWVKQPVGRPVFIGSSEIFREGRLRCFYFIYRVTVFKNGAARDCMPPMLTLTAREVRLGNFDLYTCFLLDCILEEEPFLLTAHFDHKWRLRYLKEGGHMRTRILYGRPLQRVSVF